MSSSRNRCLAAALMMLLCAPAVALERTPVQACAIIHATWLAKVNAGQLKGVAKYCKKFIPNLTEANIATRAMIAGGIAARLNAQGVAANNKIKAIGGRERCDGDLVLTFPKKVDWTSADFTAYLDGQREFCQFPFE